VSTPMPGASTIDVSPAVALEGWMSLAELQLLAQLASEGPADAAIVEIGTYRGRSTVALAIGSRAGHGPPVYTFDPRHHFVGPRGGKAFGPPDQAALYGNLAEVANGIGETVFVVSLDSRLVARAWSQPVSLLFVDGDHARHAVAGDFWAWRPHLQTDALVAFDDTDYEDVDAVVQSLVALGELVPVEQVGKVAVFGLGGGR
jgi:hypothetical protein